MRIPFYVLGFGFALSAVFVTAQTHTDNPQTPQVNPGAGAQTKAGTPVPNTTAPSATGGVSGSASSSTGQSPDVQNSTGGISA